MEEQLITLNFTKENIQNLLECLLQSSSVDLIGNFDVEKCNNFFNIAKSIRYQYPHILTENLEVLDNEKIPYEDDITSSILKIFPEISKSEINL
jgi:hypothetical protein